MFFLSNFGFFTFYFLVEWFENGFWHFDQTSFHVKSFRQRNYIFHIWYLFVLIKQVLIPKLLHRIGAVQEKESFTFIIKVVESGKFHLGFPRHKSGYLGPVPAYPRGWC